MIKKPHVWAIALALLMSVIMPGNATAQVGIGTTTPDASSALQISSSSKGLLIPQMTMVQRVAIVNPAPGLLVYQTDSTKGFYYNAGTQAIPSWISVVAYTLQQNVNTNGKWISPDGTSKGLFVNATGVGVGNSIPDRPLTITATGSGNDLLSFKDPAGSTQWYWNMPTDGMLNFSQVISGINHSRLLIDNSGNVGINNTTPQFTLDVFGTINSAGDISTGTAFNMGTQYVRNDASLDGHQFAEFSATCPAGTRLMGGGGGHRDFNNAQTDIVVNYSGPDLSDPGSGWILRVDNTGSDARAIVVYAICGKIK